MKSAAEDPESDSQRKILKFDEEDSKKVQEPLAKSVNWMALKEKENQADKNFLQRQSDINDMKLNSGQVRFPSFQIGTAQKHVVVEYIFKNGEISVILQKGISDKIQRELKLTLPQWTYFQGKSDLILEFIKAVEGESNKSVEEILKVEENMTNFQELNYGWKQYRTFLIDDIMLTYRWCLKSKNCTIDIRQGEMFKSSDGKISWRGSCAGICLCARGYDYLFRFLAPKICTSIQMWGEMHNASRREWHSLFATSPEIETENDTDDDSEDEFSDNAVNYSRWNQY